MKLNMRTYEPLGFWKIRAFLRETFLLNGRRELNWQAGHKCYASAGLKDYKVSRQWVKEV